MGVFIRRTVAMFAVIMLLALTISASAKPIHSSFTITTAARFSGTELKAGGYDVTADDTKITLKVNGGVVAEAKVEWKEGTDKAAYTSVLTVGGDIKEIRFKGMTRYAVVTP